MASTERHPIALPNRNTLRKYLGRSPEYDFNNWSSNDMVKFEDDFTGSIAVASRMPGYTLNKNGTSAADAVLVADATNGTIIFDSGTDTESHSALYLGDANTIADQNPVVRCLVSIDDITLAKIEVGFTDITTDAGAILVLNTPTTTADDCVVAVYDTDATLDVWQFAGARAGGSSDWSISDIGIAPVNDVKQWITVALRRTDLATDNVDAFMWIDNKLVAHKSVGATSNTVKLHPYVLVQTRTTSARFITVDYFGSWWDRDTSA